MQNYKVHAYVISMEFSAVNRRRPSRETPLGPGAKKDRCFRRLVDRLLSKALADNQISDGEFQLLMAEFSQYNMLKDAVRAKLTRQSSRPDVEKIKKTLRSEVEAEFRKKNNCFRRRFELTYQKFNSGFHFSVTKSHA